MVLSWEEKIGHGSTPVSAISPSSLPYTSKFRHRFCPEAMWEELCAMVLS